MFIAMNRFQIAHGFEDGFEQVWRQRESYLSEVPGFKTFNLLKGPVREDHVLYASHSVWESTTTPPLTTHPSPKSVYNYFPLNNL